jgi:hypothetical protein
MQKAKVEMKFALKIALALVAALLFIISQASCSIVPYQTSHTEFTSQSLEELKKGAVYINLGKTITAGSPDVVIDGSRIAIAAAGTYLISGTLDDGPLIIDTKDLEAVKLILNGVNITCADNAPIYVENAEEVEIYLAEGTENIITDGDSYILGDTTSDDPNAAIFSKDDLTITGSGSLTVNANYNNGIQSKDDLKITGGTIIVNAANDGVKGRDSITIRDAAITINTGGDGMQSNNDEDAKKGTVLIESGTLTIIAAADGIQAQTGLGRERRRHNHFHRRRQRPRAESCRVKANACERPSKHRYCMEYR